MRALIGIPEIPLAPVWAWALFAEKANGLVPAGGTLIISTAVVYIVGPNRRGKNGPPS